MDFNEDYLDPDVRLRKFVEEQRIRQQQMFLKPGQPPSVLGVSHRPYKFKLTITPGMTYFTHERPSAWVRFWQNFLLGWQWEKLEER